MTVTRESPRFWVGGPCFEPGDPQETWLVIDGLDLPGQRPARKPDGYTERWLSEQDAHAHAAEMNDGL